MVDANSFATVCRRLAIALVVLGILLGAAGTSTAHAGGYGYYWKLEFDFEQGVHGLLTVDAGPGEVGAPDKVLVSRQFRVACVPVGNVTVAGGVATFNGGYLQCRLDLATAIDQTFAECSKIDPACTYELATYEVYPSVRMHADVRASQIGANPIFFHPDLSFTADLPTPTILTLRNQVNPAGAIESPQISLPGMLGSWQSYAARYVCAPGPACDMTYSAAGNTWPVGPFGQQPAMQSAPAEFYVGYDPAGGIVLPAATQLDNLFIDPPNLGNH